MRKQVAAILLAGFAAAALGGADMESTISEVKARHQDRLLNLPGVVSVGVGLDETGQQAIIVGLDRRREQTLRDLPMSLEGYSVVVQVIGEIRPQ